MKTKKLKKEYLFFLFILIALFMFSYDVFAVTCPPSRPNLLFSYTGFTNAQAVNSNAGAYAVCSSQAKINTTASNIELITLSSITNAHVEKNNQVNYNLPIWIQAAPGVNSISVYYQASNCNAGDECSFSISSDTNAHVANCTGTGSYTTKVCIGGVSCGVEGATCPLTALNQQDSCCTAIQSPPGYMCRYYETANYQTKCCAINSPNLIYSNCTWNMYSSQGGSFIYPTCVPRNTNITDAACCNLPTDCVYNGTCYANNTLVNIFTNATNQGLEHCTEKHWCPEGFDYRGAPYYRCEAAVESCYIGSLNNYCTITSYPYYDVDHPYNCLYGGPGSNPPQSLPYEKDCCLKYPLGIMNYYEWEYVDVYGTWSGNPE